MKIGKGRRCKNGKMNIYLPGNRGYLQEFVLKASTLVPELISKNGKGTQILILF